MIYFSVHKKPPIPSPCLPFRNELVLTLRIYYPLSQPPHFIQIALRRLMATEDLL